MSVWLTMFALGVLALLCWILNRLFGADRLAAFNEKRRPTAHVVGRGEFVDGNRHVQVALALTRSTFYYENDDIQGSLELHWISEIEYDTRLSTGAASAGGKVLRLRCYSQSFEFVLPEEMVARWHMNLPPRRASARPGEPVRELVPVVSA